MLTKAEAELRSAAGEIREIEAKVSQVRAAHERPSGLEDMYSMNIP